MKERGDQFNINFSNIPEKNIESGGSVPSEENEVMSGEREFHKDYVEYFENGEWKNEYIPVVNLNFPEDFSKVKKDPVAYEALMKQIAKLEEQNEINEMEKAAEVRGKAEDEEQRKIELRESIFKALEDDDIKDNDNSWQYEKDRLNAEEINAARLKKEEELKDRKKLNREKNKSKKRWWKKGGDSIEDIIDKNNQR